MKSIHVIIGCCILFLLASCVSPINCRKCFKIYREPVVRCDSFDLYAGIFVSLNGKDALCFYNNGCSKTISSFPSNIISFWLNPEVEITNLLENDQYFRKELWGHFRIFNDTIVIQSFGLSNDQLCRRAVYETKGVILNDSTIKVFSDYSYWFDSELIKEPKIYRLYKTDHKPDSTLAWFNKKRWYKKNLHESRR
ncbi:MAG: hypothetical protein KKD74_03930 [Bacteroidetes bacterium]|nr:hypothetical protein [Bacteroidota bacterium]